MRRLRADAKEVMYGRGWSARGFRAVWASLLLAALPAGAQDEAPDEAPVVLEQARGWRGMVEVRSQLQPSPGVSGDEVQTERVEFFAVTDPKRTADAADQLQLRLARAKGAWSVKIDIREPRGASEVATTGAASGELDFVLTGVLDIGRGEARLRFGTHGQRLAVKTTLSGMDGAGFATFRTVAMRRSVLDGAVEKGAFDAEGRSAKGEREFVVKRGTYASKVHVRWSLERLEPEVRGRIVDQHGRPAAGLRVIARTTPPADPGYIANVVMLEAKSGPDGRFVIPAHFGTWGVEVPGMIESGVLTRGWIGVDAASLRFDHVPDLEVEVVTYALARLPRTDLLRQRFADDVNGFMAFLDRRYSKAALAAARVARTNATN